MKANKITIKELKSYGFDNDPEMMSATFNTPEGETQVIAYIEDEIVQSFFSAIPEADKETTFSETDFEGIVSFIRNQK